MDNDKEINEETVVEKVEETKEVDTGESIEDNEENSDVAENTTNIKTKNKKSKKLSKKVKIRIVIGIVIGIVIVGIYASVKINKDNSKKYHQDIEMVASMILTEGSNDEKMVNVYKTIWSNSISNNLEMVDYSKTLGIDVAHFSAGLSRGKVDFKKTYKGNFNQALLYISVYYKNNGETNTLDKAVDTIEIKIKELNNPPKEYKEAYQSLLNMYTSLQTFHDYATSPSGSLVSYNNKVLEKDEEMMKYYNEYKVKLPEVKE